MWTLAELAPLLGAVVGTSPDFVVDGPAPHDSDAPGGLAYCLGPKQVRSAAVGALILPPDLVADRPSLTADNPKAAFARFLALCRHPLPLVSGVHPTAIVDPGASVASDVSIGPYAVVERERGSPLVRGFSRTAMSVRTAWSGRTPCCIRMLCCIRTFTWGHGALCTRTRCSARTGSGSCGTAPGT
ncbi:hypothetical protein GCM10029964_081500 [Kibdelosporangium lantanae]